MISNEKKAELYRCITRQFPDAGLYRVSRVTEWLKTNGYSLGELGYGSFRGLAEDFPEVFGFQQDNNDEFIEIKKWRNGIDGHDCEEHPADNFFGSLDVILNDDIIEMSQKSLYALTKILDNGYTVQEMKQDIFEQFENAKHQGNLSFSAERYTFPIGYCRDGAQVRGLVTKNLNSYGKSLYFAFEKTAIYNTPYEAETKKTQKGSLPDEAKERIYNLLTVSFPCEQELHLSTICKFLSDHGIDRIRYGYAKMKDLIADLGFISLYEEVLGGVPQFKIVIHAKHSAAPTPQRPHLENNTSDYSENAHTMNSHYGNTKPQGYYNTSTQPIRYGDNPQQERQYYTQSANRYNPAPRPAEIPQERLSDICNLPNKPISILENHLMKKGLPADYFDIIRELNEDFDKARAEGKVKISEEKMSFPIRYLRDDNTNIELTLKPSAYDGKKWFLYYVDLYPREKSPKSVSPGKQLENFAFLGSWSNFLAELAAKAVDEEWDFPNSTRRSYQILIQYIKYTFSRLSREKKVRISPDKEFAAFNTGLADNHYDDIYACFVPNDTPNDTEWKFAGFCTEASGGLGKQLVDKFEPLPEPPSYFSRNEDLFYDHTKKLYTDFKHIIIDNIKRLPLQFLYDQFFDTPDARDLVDKIRTELDRYTRDTLYEQLKGIIIDNSRLFVRIQNRIKDSIELAQKRVRWNYKTAVPSYFPKRDSMSLMLPLALVDESKPDVALVVELTRSGSYQGQTILTLAQAYIDARLMCRLTGDWLIPENVVSDNESSDEELTDIE